MGVVPTGQFSLRAGTDRLDLTIAGVLFGQYRVAFDRRLGIFERDGRTVCALDQITAIDVQATATGPGSSYSSMLVVAHQGGVEHLYVNEDKETVAELAAKTAELLGLQVTFREQPFERQVREAPGSALPSADQPWTSPLRLLRPIAGALSAWGAFVRGIVGLGLLVMGGQALQAGAPQGGAPIIGGILVLMGLFLLVGAALQATRSVRRGNPGLDPTGVSSSAGAAQAARSAPAGASHGSTGLFELVGRTRLVIASIAVVIASGIMVVMVTTEVEGNAAIGFLVGLGFAGVSGFVAWQAIGNLRIWRAIQASPVPVEAVVQEVRSVSSKPPRYALDYRYQDSAGGQHLGRSFPLSSAEAGHWRPFDVAAIIFNRHRPEQSMLASLRPIRRATREEGRPDGDPTAPSRRPATGSAEE